MRPWVKWGSAASRRKRKPKRGGRKPACPVPGFRCPGRVRKEPAQATSTKGGTLTAPRDSSFYPLGNPGSSEAVLSLGTDFDPCFRGFYCPGRLRVEQPDGSTLPYIGKEGLLFAKNTRSFGKQGQTHKQMLAHRSRAPVYPNACLRSLSQLLSCSTNTNAHCVL